MNRLVCRIQKSWWGRIIAEHDTEPEELRAATTDILVGFWLFLPFNTFSASPTFYVMTVLPELIWALGFLTLGGVGLYILRSGDLEKRRKIALINFLIWGALAFVFVFGNPPAIGWLLFMYAAIGQGWCTIRLGLLMEAKYKVAG